MRSFIIRTLHQIKVIRSRKMRWGLEARMGDIRNVYRIIVVKLEVRDHLGD
jgi:hypothetical protein